MLVCVRVCARAHSDIHLVFPRRVPVPFLHLNPLAPRIWRAAGQPLSAPLIRTAHAFRLDRGRLVRRRFGVGVGAVVWLPVCGGTRLDRGLIGRGSRNWKEGEKVLYLGCFVNVCVLCSLQHKTSLKLQETLWAHKEFNEVCVSEHVEPVNCWNQYRKHQGNGKAWRHIRLN